MQHTATEKKVSLTVHYNPASKMGRWLKDHGLTVKVKCIKTPTNETYWNLSLMDEDNQFVAGAAGDYYGYALMQSVSMIITGETMQQPSQSC